MTESPATMTSAATPASPVEGVPAEEAGAPDEAAGASEEFSFAIIEALKSKAAALGVKESICAR